MSAKIFLDKFGDQCSAHVGVVYIREIFFRDYIYRSAKITGYIIWYTLVFDIIHLKGLIRFVVPREGSTISAVASGGVDIFSF